MKESAFNWTACSTNSCTTPCHTSYNTRMNFRYASLQTTESAATDDYQVAKVSRRRPHRIRKENRASVLLRSPRASTPSRTSIRSAIFAQWSCETYRVTDAQDYQSQPSTSHSTSVEGNTTYEYLLASGSSWISDHFSLCGSGSWQSKNG